MILSIISFTVNGRRLSLYVKEMLERETPTRLYTKCSACLQEDTDLSVCYVNGSVREWAGEQMREKNALLFIGACGIAVRAAAPFLTDKLQDAPVLVMDEGGRYVIPILSGHMGGANRLAERIALKTGAKPVITTATDLDHKFAVDLFAKNNGLSVTNKEGIARVSAKVLSGKEITISIETGHRTDGSLPAGIRLVPYPPDGFADVVITSKNRVFDASILLRPREYVIGMGCKRGKSFSEIDGFISRKLTELGILATQLYALASVAQKAKEQGIIEWCRKQRIPFLTFTAEELQETGGSFAESSFVREQVGVGNVCERAAVRAGGEGSRLIALKEAEDGMTIAVAKREWKVCFDGK